MKMAGLHATVVGAATGGAAAALLLARAGARVTLIEKIAEPRAVGAGIAIAENGLAVLEGLGLGPPLAAAGSLLDAPRITDARERTLIAAPPMRVLMIRRADLMRILLDAVAAEPRIETRFGVEVSDATALEGELVVAADGVHSRVREAADFGAHVAGTGIRYLRGLAGADLARGVEAWTAAGVFGSFPVPGGTYFFASAGTPALRATIENQDLDGLRTVWSAAYPPAAEILGAVERFDQLLFNEVVRVRCRRFAAGRIALLGDAAHAMAPNLGQGANSALVDAAVLVDELRRADTVDGALAAYDRRRRPAVDRVATTAGRLGRLAERTHPAFRWVRDRMLLPLAAAVTGPGATRTVLQEPPDALRVIAGGAR